MNNYLYKLLKYDQYYVFESQVATKNLNKFSFWVWLGFLHAASCATLQVIVGTYLLDYDFIYEGK